MLPFYRIIAVVMVLLLIIVFVLVVILQSSTNQVHTFSEARNICESAGRASCRIIKNIPSTWNINSIILGNKSQTCQEIMECDTCESCRFS